MYVFSAHLAAGQFGAFRPVLASAVAWKGWEEEGSLLLFLVTQLSPQLWFPWPVTGNSSSALAYGVPTIGDASHPVRQHSAKGTCFT